MSDKRIMTKEEQLPCGCIERHYDKEVQTVPCPPHALAEAGRQLHLAGQMLNAAANRLLQEQQRIAAAQAAEILRKS